MNKTLSLILLIWIASLISWYHIGYVQSSKDSGYRYYVGYEKVQNADAISVQSFQAGYNEAIKVNATSTFITNVVDFARSCSNGTAHKGAFYQIGDSGHDHAGFDCTGIHFVSMPNFPAKNSVHLNF